MAGLYRMNAAHDGKFSQLELKLAKCIQENYEFKEYVSSQTGYKEIIGDYQKNSSEINKLIAKSSQIYQLIEKSSEIDELIQEKNKPGFFSFLSRTKPVGKTGNTAHMSTLLQQMKDLNTDHQY
jgi:hypothetical protein